MNELIDEILPNQILEYNTYFLEDIENEFDIFFYDILDGAIIDGIKAKRLFL